MSQRLPKKPKEPILAFFAPTDEWTVRLFREDSENPNREASALIRLRNPDND